MVSSFLFDMVSSFLFVRCRLLGRRNSGGNLAHRLLLIFSILSTKIMTQTIPPLSPPIGLEDGWLILSAEIEAVLSAS